MKFNLEPSHQSTVLNTLTLTGLSVLWGVMLALISPWWLLASCVLLFAGHGTELRKRDHNVRL